MLISRLSLSISWRQLCIFLLQLRRNTQEIFPKKSMYFYATALVLHQLHFEQVGEKQQDSMKRSPSMPSENTLRKMSIPLLAEHCIRELEVYRRGGPSNDQYSL